MFLQCVVAAGCLPQSAAAAKLQEVAAAFPRVASLVQPADLSAPRVVRALNLALVPLSMELKWVRAEADGKWFLVFANTQQDDMSKGVLDAADRDTTLAVMKTVVNCLVERKCVRGTAARATAAAHPIP